MATTSTAGNRAGSTRARSGGRSAATDDQVLTRLREYLLFLRLSHTSKHLDELLAWATHERPGYSALLERVFGDEIESKREARITRRVTISGLVERKTLEAFDWAFQPSLDRSAIIELGRLDFVDRKEDLVITGKAQGGVQDLMSGLDAPAQSYETVPPFGSESVGRQAGHEVALIGRCAR